MAASRPKSTGLTLTSRIFTAHAQSLFYDIYKQQMADLRAVRPRLPWGHDQQKKNINMRTQSIHPDNNNNNKKITNTAHDTT